MLKRSRPDSCVANGVILAGGHALSPGLVNLWRLGTYCDVILRTTTLPPHQVSAHRLVLAAGSDRLAGLVAEAQPADGYVGLSAIDLPLVRSDVLDAVVEYLYCGQVEVDATDGALLDAIAAAATQLDMPALHETARLAARDGPPAEGVAVEADATVVNAAEVHDDDALSSAGPAHADLSGPVYTPIVCPSAEEFAAMTYHEFAVELGKIDAQLKGGFHKQKDRALKAFAVSEATLSEALKPKDRQAIKKLGLRVANEWVTRIGRARHARPEATADDLSKKQRRESFRSSSYKLENTTLDEWLQQKLETMRQQGGKFTPLVEDDILQYVNANLATWNKDRLGQSVTAQMDRKTLRNWMNKHGFPRGAFSGDELAQPMLHAVEGGMATDAVLEPTVSLDGSIATTIATARPVEPAAPAAHVGSSEAIEVAALAEPMPEGQEEC